MKLALAILGVLGPALGLFVWWVKGEQRRARVRLLAEIEALERKVAHAAAIYDLDALAECNDELIRLRRKARVSA